MDTIFTVLFVGKIILSHTEISLSLSNRYMCGFILGLSCFVDPFLVLLCLDYCTFIISKSDLGLQILFFFILDKEERGDRERERETSM